MRNYTLTTAAGARLLVAISLAGSLLACATQDRSRAVNVIATPLADINLIQTEIPPILSAAFDAKYQLPRDTGCQALAQQIVDLDSVLGDDFDADTPDKPSLYERGRLELKDATYGALRSTSESVIPFRGWVRKLSGAERYSKKVQSAIQAGSLRRAFLKGILNGQGCAS